MNIETAGARLKKMRQEKGLTLEDIQKRTKIHLNVLRTIEGDSLSELSPIYLKSFIKIYCNCLGLDPKEYTGETIPQRNPVLNATVGRGIGERIEKKASFIKDASLKFNAIKPAFKFKKIIIFVVLVVIFIFLAANLIKFISNRRKNPIERAKTLSLELTKGAKNRSVIKKEIPQSFVLGLFARDKSWISVKVDGKTVFHGVLARGRSETWPAKERIELSLGDAGAVELQVNDQRFANLGRRGHPLKNIVINKEGLKIYR